MTNFEYFKDIILKITNRGEHLAIVDGKPVACESFNDCRDCCQLDMANCQIDRMKWLYAEHIEKPRLTKKERQFCELVESGWIARNKNGDLYFYEPYIEPPYKLDKADSTIWRHDAMMYFLSDENSDLFHIQFTFIKWGDTEPWSIEDLLKLEVEE